MLEKAEISVGIYNVTKLGIFAVKKGTYICSYKSKISVGIFVVKKGKGYLL